MAFYNTWSDFAELKRFCDDLGRKIPASEALAGEIQYYDADVQEKIIFARMLADENIDDAIVRHYLDIYKRKNTHNESKSNKR